MIPNSNTFHPENDSISYDQLGKKDDRDILIILDNSLNISSKINTYIYLLLRLLLK